MRVALRRWLWLWVVGGMAGAVLPALVCAGAPAQAPETWFTSDCPPRLGAAAVLDSRRNRLLVLGGFDGIQRSDVWALSLDGLATWTRLDPAGVAPPGRSGHTAFYDVERDRVLMFGGSGDGGLLGDLWELSLAGAPSWMELGPVGARPTARADHAIAYDPQRDCLLMFGGWDHPTHFLNEVWSLSLGGAPQWQLLDANPGPSPRKDAAAVFDAANDRLLIFGGIDTGYRNDVWALALKPSPTWSPVTVHGTPPSGRRDAAVVMNAERRSVLLFGGLDGAYRDDTWELRLEADPKWEQLSGNAPPRRSYHAITLDAARARVLVFGGFNGSLLQDTWTMPLAAGGVWTRVAPAFTAPSPRLGHAGIYDPVAERFVVFGGYDGVYRNETWALGLGDVPEWSPVTASGTLPAARIRHSVVYDAARHRLIVHGGQGVAQISLGDTWVLPLAGPPVWSQLIAAGPVPLARANHSAIYDPAGDRMLVFGGMGATGGLRSDTWVLRFDPAPVWEVLNVNAPEARSGHVAIHDPVRQRMLVFGGVDVAGAPRQDLWELSLGGDPAWPAWSEVEWLGVPPPGRAYHTSAYDAMRARAYIFGGYDGMSPYRNDLWELDLASKPTWRLASVTGALPAPRGYTSCIFDSGGDVLRVFGGGGTRLGDSWTYAPGGAPSKPAVAAHEAVVVAAFEVSPSILRPGTASFRIRLAAASRARLEVFDVRGRLIKSLFDARLDAGAHRIAWDATDAHGRHVAAGTYHCRLTSGDGVHARRLQILH